MFVALFSLSAYGATQRALYGALALCVITYVLPLVSTQRWSPWSPAVWAPAVGLVWVSLLGASTRRRRLAGEEHVRQVAEVAAAQARERMADERLQVRPRTPRCAGAHDFGDRCAERARGRCA